MRTYRDFTVGQTLAALSSGGSTCLSGNFSTSPTAHGSLAVHLPALLLSDPSVPYMLFSETNLKDEVSDLEGAAMQHGQPSETLP